MKYILTFTLEVELETSGSEDIIPNRYSIQNELQSTLNDFSRKLPKCHAAVRVWYMGLAFPLGK